jgi:hypothetical protein
MSITFTNDQKQYLISELQSKIKEIIDQKIEIVEQFDDDGECYEDDFYIGSSFDLELQLNCALVETILK